MNFNPKRPLSNNEKGGRIKGLDVRTCFEIGVTVLSDIEENKPEEQQEANNEPSWASLAEGLAAYSLDFPEEQIEQLDRYRTTLWGWNEKMNLTRHTTIDKFITRDVVDSYELSKLIAQKSRVLDVGTGGGVPGLILAVIRPDLKISVCDSTQKKAKAVESMIEELGLKIRVYACRSEEVLDARRFETLVARAVAPLTKILRWFDSYWSTFDELLLIKGQRWVDERSEARQTGLLNKLELRRAAVYPTPGTNAESVILRLTQKE